MALTRGQWIASVLLSLVLAFPMTTLISSMVIFPLLAFGLLAVMANTGPILLIIVAGLRRFGWAPDWPRLLPMWQASAILWIGCAYGLSHWGDVGSSIGAKNSSYLKMLFAPWLFLAGQPIV